MKTIVLILVLLTFFQQVSASPISVDVLYDVITKDCGNSIVYIPEKFTYDGQSIPPIELPGESDKLKTYIQFLEARRPFATQGGGISILPGLGDGSDVLTCNGKSLTIDGYTFIWDGDVIDPYALYTLNQHFEDITTDKFVVAGVGNATIEDNSGFFVFRDTKIERVDISLMISLTIASYFILRKLYKSLKKEPNSKE